ncbi:MAG: acyl carrier protein, partial [Legionella sp.]|nr:acyl carrier protein [Legionella sp.]
MMAAPKTFDELLPIFRDIFDRDDLVLTPSLAAEDVDEWDSLSNIRLFVAIEQAFGIRFAS